MKTQTQINPFLHIPPSPTLCTRPTTPGGPPCCPPSAYPGEEKYAAASVRGAQSGQRPAKHIKTHPLVYVFAAGNEETMEQRQAKTINECTHEEMERGKPKHKYSTSKNPNKQAEHLFPPDHETGQQFKKFLFVAGPPAVPTKPAITIRHSLYMHAYTHAQAQAHAHTSAHAHARMHQHKEGKCRPRLFAIAKPCAELPEKRHGQRAGELVIACLSIESA